MVSMSTLTIPTFSRPSCAAAAISLRPNNPIRFIYNHSRPILLPKSSPFTAVISCAVSPQGGRIRPEYTPNRISDPNYVRIFDTTLRDGEQSPGATMTSKEKLDIARQLAKLGVDIIEAGFPAASKDDLEAVKSIAKEVGNAVDENGYVPVICGLARCNKKDIDSSWEAVQYAKRPRIHTFIATSEIHMKYKLKKTKEEVIETARSMVRYARSLGCDDVEFSPEDAGRSEREFLYQILGEVIKAGATTVNIPDTVGINLPSEFGQLIADIKANTPGIENAIISTHCQNDLGLSTANTLSGAFAGARQLEVTINGIGERAGNASLEEVVMAIKCRGEQILGGLYTGINERHIVMTSKMVEEYSGLHLQPHKAIVGANAFAHESGIHQDGMLKHKNTYEIISPEDIGLYRSNESGIVLGKLRSRHTPGGNVNLVYRGRKIANDSHSPIDEKIHDRTVPGYATLIGSYCRSERWEEVFSLLGLMIRDGILPDKYLVPTILKACSAVRFLRYGKMVHGYAVRLQLEKDIVVGNALMNFYGNCFNMVYSKNMFDSIQEKDVVSWSTLISSYMNIGLVEEAEHSFHEMQLNGVNPDVITWNALVSGFARNGEIESAIVYLNGFIPNVTSWNGIISGFVQNGCFEEALDMFSEMLNFPENPNVVTIVSILPACAFSLGRAIHGYAIKKKLHENILVAGSVMNMYSKCGAFECTEKVFTQTKNKNTALWNEIIASHVDRGKMGIALEFITSMQKSGLEPDEISYNTILSGYARNGKKNEAYDLLSKMNPTIVSFNILISGFQQSGLSYEALTSFIILQSHSTITLNSVTISSILAACADLNVLTLGKEIHGYILRNSYESNIFVSTAVIDMYAKCRDINSAVKVFHARESRNTVSWNSLINGHIQNDNPDEAFKLFNEMLDHGAEPSLITFMILVSLCVEMTELSVGRSLHGYILKTRNMRSNRPLVNAVIDMYVKCGCISDGKCVFDSDIGRNDSQWDEIVSGLLSNP